METDFQESFSLEKLGPGFRHVLDADVQRPEFVQFK